jgi:hypothetical protein
LQIKKTGLTELGAISPLVETGGQRMTHNELLADIDTKILLSEHTIYPIYMQAFRAVVELHKPVLGFTGGYDGEENELWEEQCQECSSNGFSQMYPCPTIQAIEKELE